MRTRLLSENPLDNKVRRQNKQKSKRRAVINGLEPFRAKVVEVMLLVICLGTSLISPSIAQSTSPISCPGVVVGPAGSLASAIQQSGLQPVNVNESALQIAPLINQTLGLVNGRLNTNFVGLKSAAAVLQKAAEAAYVITAYNNLVRDADSYNPNDSNSACQLYVDAFVLGASVGMFDAPVVAGVLTVAAFTSDLTQIQQITSYCTSCDCLNAVISVLDNTMGNFLSSDYSAAWFGVKQAVTKSCTYVIGPANQAANSLPEFPPQPLPLSILTFAVVALYLMTRRRGR
jgi:hypothetical protein